MPYKVALIADNHFIMRTEKKVYVNGTYTKQYLKRFTSNFDEVVVIARCSNAKNDEDTRNLRESGGEGVVFFKLDDFRGVNRYIKSKNIIKKDMMKALESVDAIFVRMPCILTNIALDCAKEKNIPIMIDVGADPDSIYRSSKTTLFELLISKYMMRVCQKNCMLANGVSYVTREILQQKYPCRAIKYGESKEYFTASISNVDMSNDFFYSNRNYDLRNKQVKILHISNNICPNSGKGHIECIDVLKKLNNLGINSVLTFVGGGNGISELFTLAEKSGVTNQIKFTGRIVEREEYRKIILEHDIFLFPSHSEGLPRVLIETMATGMVCVASNVDGIPEILRSNDIFQYWDIQGMANRINTLILNKDECREISQRNYEIAKNYSNDVLKYSYYEYYQKLRKLIDLRKNKL